MKYISFAFLNYQLIYFSGTDHLTCRGGLWFFVSFRIFFSNNTELEYLFFCRAKRVIFFPEFNIRLFDKNSESDYFFFLHQNQKKNFSNIGNQNIFLEKKHNPSFKLNGCSLTNILCHIYEKIIKIIC